MSSRRTKVTLAPEVLLWSRERASLGHEELAGKVDVKPETVEGWEKSEKISFAQIDRLADRSYTPSGFLFLSEPPAHQVSLDCWIAAMTCKCAMQPLMSMIEYQ